ncbi:MAG: hypothetical protein ACOC3V_00740 [bacterium]
MGNKYRISVFKKNVGAFGDFTKYTLQKKFLKLFWLDITTPTTDKEKLEKIMKKLT